jgi:hypothetical protein
LRLYRRHIEVNGGWGAYIQVIMQEMTYIEPDAALRDERLDYRKLSSTEQRTTAAQDGGN